MLTLVLRLLQGKPTQARIDAAKKDLEKLNQHYAVFERAAHRDGANPREHQRLTSLKKMRSKLQSARSSLHLACVHAAHPRVVCVAEVLVALTGVCTRKGLKDGRYAPMTPDPDR